MDIAPEPLGQAVIALLSECGLPVADLSASSPARFFGARAGGTLVGVVGLEASPPSGLLRSLAVTSAWRRRGVGRALVEHAEAVAARHGIERLFLLTQDAAGFFLNLGYQATQRGSVPDAIRATAQFAALCPSTSACLSKRIDAPRRG
jgi:amino-acid N-acetyltransferase